MKRKMQFNVLFMLSLLYQHAGKILNIQMILSSLEVDCSNWEYRLKQYLEHINESKRSLEQK